MAPLPALSSAEPFASISSRCRSQVCVDDAMLPETHVPAVARITAAAAATDIQCDCAAFRALTLKLDRVLLALTASVRIKGQRPFHYASRAGHFHPKLGLAQLQMN